MGAKIYACLLGEWTDITNSDTLIDNLPIETWLQTKSPIRADRIDENDLITYKEKILKSPLVNISYEGKNYLINPIFIQIMY